MTLTSKGNIQAKTVFENFAARYCDKIQQYYADNVRFEDNALVSFCEDNEQHLVYCRVNAHFQNGITERASRDGQEQARISLPPVITSWPGIVDLSLWIYTDC